MSPRVARWAYSGLMCTLWPVLAGRWWWRARAEPGYGEALPERYGVYGASSVQAGAVWIHAVSLGETRAAEPLIAALRRQRPTVRLLLTHGTATGRDTGRALLRDGDRQTWLPVDSPGAVRRFLRHWQPACGVLMETEIWPNLQHAAQQAGVPMVLANARLSDKSLRQARRFQALLRPAVASLRLVLAQTQADADRLTQAGAPAAAVTGNLKFDLQPDATVLARGEAWRAALAQGTAPAMCRPVVLAAVWREGEDEPLLAAWASARTHVQAETRVSGAVETRNSAAGRAAPILLIVPRHPQRFDEVARLILAAGFTVSRRSTWPLTGPDAQALAADVWLGDTLREMPAYYAVADVALLGGSFAPLGGQNLIEAAACGCPVLMGPHTFNFAAAAELALTAGAAQRVETLEAAVTQANSRAKAGMPVAERARCQAFAREHQGASQRSAEAILRLLRHD